MENDNNVNQSAPVAGNSMEQSNDVAPKTPIGPTSDRDALKEASNTTNVLNRILQPDRKDKPYPDLFSTKESRHSEQGIDPTAFPELNLPIKKIMTPSGIKDVICIMDSTTMEHRPTETDYLPGYDLPEIGHVWSARQETILGEGLFDPVFSPRTTEQMKFCNLFHSGCLARLICKTPLTTAISFWVHRTARTSSIDTFRSEPGFAWRPSVQNEVFVLMPWLAVDNTLPYNQVLTDAFLRLGIRPLSDLVREEGTATTLDVSVYFAPYDMRLYAPRPVSDTSSPVSIITESISIPPTNFVQSVFPTENLGSITLAAPAKARVTQLNTFTSLNDSYNVSLNLDLADAGSISLDDAVGSNAAGYFGTALDLPAGIIPVSVTSVGDAAMGVEITSNGINIDFDSIDGGVNPVFTPAFLANKSGNKVEPTQEVETHLDGWNRAIHIDPKILNPISRFSNGIHLSGQRLRTEAEVISQDPNIVKVRVFVNDTLVAVAQGKNAKTAKYKAIQALLPLCNFTIRSGERQIFEYQYNTRSGSAGRLYGNLGDHSVREDTHWQQFQDINITEAVKGQLFNVNFNMSNLPSTFPPVATREYTRHLLKTRIPNLKIQTIKTPFSNAMARVTVGTQATTEEAMQLPGLEWDMASELRLEPYWTYRNPANSNVTIDLTIMILSASVSDAGMQLIAFFNTGNMEYFHMRDYDFAGALSTIREGERQGGGVTSTNECLETKQTRFDSVSQSESTSLMTDQVVKPHDAAETRVGTLQKFVGVLEVNMSTIKIVAIPISHTNFPKLIVNTAKKYFRWRGNPKFDITNISNVTLAAPIYVCHVDSDFDFMANDAVDAIYMQPSARELIRNNTTQIMCRWRQISGSPWQTVDYSGAPQLGYIALAFPLQATTLGTLDPNVKITIECDTSDFEYSGASYVFDTFAYPGLQFQTFTTP